MDDVDTKRRQRAALKPKRHLSTLAAVAFFLLWLRSPPSDPSPTSIPDAPTRCNPFHQRGYLHVNRTSIDDNYWAPYDRSCPPSRLFRLVRQDAISPSSPDVQLPWLVNRTVALVGDSVDRAHIRHFCDLISSPFHNVSDAARDNSPSGWGMPSVSYVVPFDSPVSPPPYIHPLDKTGGPSTWPPGVYEEHKERWKSTHSNLNRPWVCRVERYNFTLVWIFTWGMDPPFEGIQFAREADFHPPSSIPLRLDHILFPLLKNLASAYQQPSMAEPDLVEMSSGPWDARSWTQLDVDMRGEHFSEDNPTVFEPSRGWQREVWAKGMRDSVRKVATKFPNAGILWRSLHHPGKSPSLSFSPSLSVLTKRGQTTTSRGTRCSRLTSWRGTPCPT